MLVELTGEEAMDSRTGGMALVISFYSLYRDSSYICTGLFRTFGLLGCLQW